MLVVLGLIDVVMISNLLIMVIIGGYETFVSRLHLERHPDQPEWLSHVNASVLKVKLATAIIGISSIHLLKTFINAAAYDEKTLIAQTGIHVVFLVSALAIALSAGIVNVFIKVGMDVRWEASMSVTEMINEGVRRAYLNPDNPLRASVLLDPAFTRKGTRDNTPAVIHYEIVPGGTVEVALAAKGGGSEAKSKFAMLNPSDSIVDWVVKTVPTMGAGWCPPGMLGIGIGGTAEKAMLLAKESLMAPIDMAELKARGPASKIEELRIELYDKVNALGIGAQGLGGLSTVLDVKLLDEVVGPAGPTTATRMDKFTEMMLAKTGLIAMVGKSERGPVAIEAIRKHRAAYLMAVGGAAYLVSKAIRKSTLLAFGDLGMEAIYEFEVADMPVTVAVDAQGESVHETGPAAWEKKIRELRIPVTAA
jgi:tartrate/fumarate subfamily iron-sulfur-dependent hydro-lyase alpha chain